MSDYRGMLDYGRGVRLERFQSSRNVYQVLYKQVDTVPLKCNVALARDRKMQML